MHLWLKCLIIRFLLQFTINLVKVSLLILSLFYSFISISQKSFETHKISSKELNEKRFIWVGLPKNYNKDNSYPVIYVLDAEHRFELTYSLTIELFENQNTIPEVIVIGIPHIDRSHRIADLTFTDSKVNARGKLDTMEYFNSSMTGNGFSFLNFLENEVVPFVDKKFSTNDFNTLIGHSIGGYFCAYILPIQKSFSAFQIYDASIWYNGGDALKQIKEQLDFDFVSNIFISKGIKFNPTIDNIDHHLSMIDSLGTVLNDYPKLKVSTATYEKDHNGMYLYSVIDGLSILYMK